MLKVGACILLVLNAAVASAATTATPKGSSTDHLEPVKTATQAAVSRDKSGEVEQILYREAFQPNVRARVLEQVFPCACEFMAFVVQAGSRFKLVDIYSDQPARVYAHPPTAPKGMPERPPPDPKNAHTLRTEIPISSSLATVIIRDWKMLLFQTRYESYRIKGMDGIYYTLSMEDDTGTYAGQSRNSGGGGNEEPTLKALERVINDMALVCDGERDLNKCFQPNIKGLGADLEKLSELLK